MKRTYQPSKTRRARTHGFLVRMKTRGGRAVINARRAVTRNTIKRQIYQVSAAFEPRLPAAAHVVRLRATFDRSQFISATSDVLKRAVRAELEQLFGRVADTGLAEQAA